jgi:2'-5' RNA ligase
MSASPSHCRVDWRRTNCERYDRAAGGRSFVVRYGPLRSFPPYPGVVYAISPEERFREFRSAIHGASVVTGVVPSREHVAPHMTIAEFISLARTEELLDELWATAPTGELVCDRIELAVPDAEFRFRRVLAVPLGEPGLVDVVSTPA